MSVELNETERDAQEFISRIVTAEVDYIVNDLGEDRLDEIAEALTGLIVVDPRDLIVIINEATQIIAQYVIATDSELREKAGLTELPIVVNHKSISDSE